MSGFEIVFMPALIVVGSELRTTFKEEKCYTEIPSFWQQNGGIIQDIPNKLYSDVILGVYTNYTSDFSRNSGYYSLIIGAPVTEIPLISEGMVIKEIPASKYAVFTAKGPFANAISKTWLEIWQNKEIERTFIADFEWYDSKSTDNEDSVIKIYVSVE